MKAKARELRLEGRQKSYDAAVQRPRGIDPKANHRPGSLKK